MMEEKRKGRRLRLRETLEGKAEKREGCTSFYYSLLPHLQTKWSTMRVQRLHLT